MLLPPHRRDLGESEVDSRGFSVLGARENVFGQWPKKLKSTTTTRDATGLINTTSLSSGAAVFLVLVCLRFEHAIGLAPDCQMAEQARQPRSEHCPVPGSTHSQTSSQT